MACRIEKNHCIFRAHMISLPDGARLLSLDGYLLYFFCSMFFGQDKGGCIIISGRDLIAAMVFYIFNILLFFITLIGYVLWSMSFLAG